MWHVQSYIGNYFSQIILFVHTLRFIIYSHIIQYECTFQYEFTTTPSPSRHAYSHHVTKVNAQAPWGNLFPVMLNYVVFTTSKGLHNVAIYSKAHVILTILLTTILSIAIISLLYICRCCAQYTNYKVSSNFEVTLWPITFTQINSGAQWVWDIDNQVRTL